MPHRNYYLSSHTRRVTSRAARSNKPSRLFRKDQSKNGKVWFNDNLDEMISDIEAEEERLLWIAEDRFELEVEIPFENYLYSLCL